MSGNTNTNPTPTKPKRKPRRRQKITPQLEVEAEAQPETEAPLPETLAISAANDNDNETGMITNPPDEQPTSPQPQDQSQNPDHPSTTPTKSSAFPPEAFGPYLTHADFPPPDWRVDTQFAVHAQREMEANADALWREMDVWGGDDNALWSGDGGGDGGDVWERELALSFQLQSQDQSQSQPYGGIDVLGTADTDDVYRDRGHLTTIPFSQYPVITDSERSRPPPPPAPPPADLSAVDRELLRQYFEFVPVREGEFSEERMRMRMRRGDDVGPEPIGVIEEEDEGED